MGKGYGNTSVMDIINTVGIAKGTLCHHFKSQKILWDALIKRQTADILVAAKKSDDKSIPVKERGFCTIPAFHVGTAQAEAKMIG